MLSIYRSPIPRFAKRYLRFWLGLGREIIQRADIAIILINAVELSGS
jgi:hypothetical protein